MTSARNGKTRRSARWLGAGWLLFALLLVAACDSTVTEDDLQKWTNNEVGLDRIRELLQDPEQPLDTKVRALEVMVEKRLEKRLGESPHPVTAALRPGVLSAVELKDRITLMSALAERLLKHVEQRDALLLVSKDAILMHLKLLSPEVADRAQRVIAQWAFGDISWELPPAEVRSKIESRMGPDQIIQLGRYGVDGAGVLLSHGFTAEAMTRYIVLSGAPDANATLIRAMKKLIPQYGLQKYHAYALLKTGEPDAAALLFELYRDPKTDEDLRELTFSLGVQMLELPKVKARSGPAVEELIKIGMAGGGEDRWLAAANIIAMTGSARLADIIAMFKDDNAYASAMDDPGKSVMDLCLDLADLEQKPQVVPFMKGQLAGGNRIQKTIAILCLKSHQADEAKPELSALAALIGKPEDVSVDDLLKGELTHGKLAKNTIEGLDLLARWDADKAAGKLDDAGRKYKRFLTIVEFELVGEDYPKAIEERFKVWLDSQTSPGAPAPGTPAPAPGAPAPAPGAPAPTPPGNP
ncbi:MAG: hypothetical protein IT385_19865 [Deltaproteobacteria bacterium]|nr:hypothetical protein [Deltaproteobacteria bacterium]